MPCVWSRSLFCDCSAPRADAIGPTRRAGRPDTAMPGPGPAPAPRVPARSGPDRAGRPGCVCVPCPRDSLRGRAGGGARARLAGEEPFRAAWRAERRGCGPGPPSAPLEGGPCGCVPASPCGGLRPRLRVAPRLSATAAPLRPAAEALWRTRRDRLWKGGGLPAQGLHQPPGHLGLGPPPLRSTPSAPPRAPRVGPPESQHGHVPARPSLLQRLALGCSRSLD